MENIKKNYRAVAIFCGALTLVAIEKRLHPGMLISLASGIIVGTLIYIVLNKLHSK